MPLSRTDLPLATSSLYFCHSQIAMSNSIAFTSRSGARRDTGLNPRFRGRPISALMPIEELPASDSLGNLNGEIVTSEF